MFWLVALLGYFAIGWAIARLLMRNMLPNGTAVVGPEDVFAVMFVSLLVMFAWPVVLVIIVLLAAVASLSFLLLYSFKVKR